MQNKLTAFLLVCSFYVQNAIGQPSFLVSTENNSLLSPQPVGTCIACFSFDTNAALANCLAMGDQPSQFILELTKLGRPIEAYYFPGKSDKRALIIAGVHGSELSSIAIATGLIRQLQQDSSLYYEVLILPMLFPDNAAMATENPSLIGSVHNIGRYSNADMPDPNRQMPMLGKTFNSGNPKDFVGRIIEQENQVMLKVIQAFKPDRILNIHAIKDVTKAGIFADPRTDALGKSLGFDSDSSLAVAMAIAIAEAGGCVSGNQLTKQPTALYYNDFPSAQSGAIQKRNFAGSQLPQKRGFGVSLGSWATTAVEDPIDGRTAIRLLTMEFPGCKRPEDYQDAESQLWCSQEVNRYIASITKVFLNNFYEE